MRISKYKVKIDNLPPSFEKFTIFQISDMHIGRGDPSNRVLRLSAKVDADLVVFTGDIIHHKRNLQAGKQFFEKITSLLNPTYGFVGILGNHECELTPNDFDNIPIHWLINDSIKLQKDNEIINLIGFDHRHWSTADMLTAMKNIEPSAPKILLAHFPSVFMFVKDRVDLIIAGHTHAGQIRFPYFPFLTNDDLHWTLGSGLNKIGKTTLIVSNGIGYSGPISIRLFAPKELVLIELTSK